MPNKPHHRVLDSLFKNKQGKIVIWQFPNIPLIGWVAFSILGLVAKHGRLHTGFHDLAQAFLFIWAYMEAKMGDSLFRRILGGFVLLGLIIGFFK